MEGWSTLRKERKERKEYIARDKINGIKQIRGAVVFTLFLSLVMALVGIALALAFYFDLIYELADNRIVEYADPWVGPYTAPFLALMGIASLISFFCSFVLLVLLIKPEKHVQATFNASAVIGVCNIFGFPVLTFIGVYILAYLYSSLPKSEKSDKRSEGKTEDNDTPTQRNNENIAPEYQRLMFSAAIYRVVVGLTLFAIYHILYVMPYEHLGVEYSDYIRILWTVMVYMNIFWIVLGAISLIIAIYSKMGKDMGGKTIGILSKIYAILNLFCMPAGTLLASQVIRAQSQWKQSKRGETNLK
jgi:hypothetical protein